MGGGHHSNSGPRNYKHAQEKSENGYIPFET